MRNALIGSLLAFLCSVHPLISQKSPDIASLTDSLMDYHLHAHEFLSGGVVLVYSKDSVLLQKGYGYADVENQISFDPDQTLVQLASVTKLITTTAILQLVESGKINLDNPVEEYIGTGIVNNHFKTKVTTRHLLTHTAGLDDRSTLMYAGSQEEIIPLDEYIQNYLPGVVWEPGKFFNYSNHAFNLLAYLVQKVAGEAYPEHIRQHILQPLEMSSSGLGYDLKNREQLMQRYNLKANDKEETWLEPVPLSYTQLPGADDFKTTSADMQHFLQMYLDSGKYKGKSILKAATIKEAFAPSFSHDESMHYKQGLGWRIMDRKDIRCVYHEGDDKGIEAALYLYPKENLGIFMAFNNQIGFDVKREIRDSFENILLAVGPEPVYPYKTYTKPQSLEGDYYYMNDAQLNFEKIIYLFKDNKVQVSYLGDTLRVGGHSYLEFRPLVFDMIGDRGKVVFIKDDHGKVQYLSFGTGTYRKLGTFQKPETHRMLLIASLAVLALSFIGSLVYGLVLKIRKAPVAFRFQRWVQLSALLLILEVVGFALSLDHIHIGQQVPLQLKILMSLSVLAAISFPVSAYMLMAIFRQGLYSVFFRILWSLELLSIGTTLWVFALYNFLGWHFY